jgi:linoleoyl-CoA desaturase
MRPSGPCPSEQTHLAAPNSTDQRPTFPSADGFQAAIKRRIDDYFRQTGRRRRDCPEMYRKMAIILTWFALSYTLLVFVAYAWWQAVPLAISLGLSMAAIGFNVQHDGGHHASSDRNWVNKLAALSLDLIGGSSYVWHWKHGILHHTYVNIAGHDDDIDLGFLARLTPHRKRLKIHRFQHWYMWALYGFAAMKWQLFDDFYNIGSGRIGSSRLPRPRGWDLLTFLAGKAVFISLAFAIPLLLHRWWVVCLFYAAVSCVTGLVLGVVFQLAHCVEQADFPLPAEDTGRMENAWAVHQVQTTVNFARKSRLAAWLFGGLNFQIEHHLFPRICHVNYPALSRLVEETCREFGVRYAVHRSFWAGIVSHYRWLRRLGRPVAA